MNVRFILGDFDAFSDALTAALPLVFDFRKSFLSSVLCVNVIHRICTIDKLYGEAFYRSIDP